MTDPFNVEPFKVPMVETVAPPPVEPPTPSNDWTEAYAAGFEYVRLPNGSIHAVRKADIQEVPETATQPVPKTAMAEVVDPHFYVWLADGNVIRVKQSDLPVPAGTNAQYGHWQIDDKVFLIVNVVPVEDIAKGDK
jgi:hypothetical protein